MSNALKHEGAGYHWTIKKYKDPNKNFWLERLMILVKNAPENGTRFKTYKMGNTTFKLRNSPFKLGMGLEYFSGQYHISLNKLRELLKIK